MLIKSEVQKENSKERRYTKKTIPSFIELRRAEDLAPT